jgi:predicted nucleotidyltransferase
LELHRPFASLTPTLDGEVLKVLAAHDAAFTTGQIHRVLNRFSEEGIRKVLSRLVRQGTVQAERVGQAYAYRLNRAHLAAEPIVALANLFSTFLARLEDQLAAWDHAPAYAAIFGSAARGTMTADSDVDLFLVRKNSTLATDWGTQVDALASSISDWTGNDARVIEYTVAELRAARTEPIVREVVEHGLTVGGSRTWLLKQLKQERDKGD